MKILFFESQIHMPIMKLPLRSVVVKTNNAVLIFSPIDFSEAQLAEIRALGEVTDIIAPSVLHHLYVPQAIQNFKNAKTWAVPGLEKKRSDIKWDKTLGVDPWTHSQEIETLMIEGVPEMREAVFLLKSEKMLLVTDLCFNMTRPKGLGAFIILHLFGTYKRFAVSKLVGRFMKDRPAFEACARKLIQWDFEKIAMAHGEVVEKDGHRLMKAALAERNYIA